jgi:hypothetical protein
MYLPLARSSVVRSGGEVGSSPSGRFAGYEAGVNLKGLRGYVKRGAEIGADDRALRAYGA